MLLPSFWTLYFIAVIFCIAGGSGKIIIIFSDVYGAAVIILTGSFFLSVFSITIT